MKNQTFFVLLLLFAVCGCDAVSILAQGKSILALADKYESALKQTENQKSRKSIASLLGRGQAVGEQIYDMESLSDADYSSLQRKMKGFLINREEVLYIEPDLEFFTKFVARHGTKADIAFISLMRSIKPDSVWAAYIEMQTDVTGCTIYGNGALTKLYGKVLQFRKIYPRDYVSDVGKEAEKITDEFTETTCACGDRASVLREFRSFIKSFPTDKNTALIKKRLAEMNKNKDFRFNCQSG